MVKNLPAMQETRFQFLGWEDLLQKGKATHYGILAQRIPWREEPGELQSMGLQRVRHDWATNTFTSLRLEKAQADRLTSFMSVYQQRFIEHLMAQLVKNPPGMRETWVQSLGWEDLLEKRKATHSSILAWRTLWTIVHGVTTSRQRLSNFHFLSFCFQVPLQYQNNAASEINTVLDHNYYFKLLFKKYFKLLKKNQ